MEVEYPLDDSEGRRGGGFRVEGFTREDIEYALDDSDARDRYPLHIVATHCVLRPGCRIRKRIREMRVFRV